MNYSLNPPLAVRGMTKLVRESFTKKYNVPSLSVQVKYLNKVLHKLKKYLLKLQNCSPIQQIENSPNKMILLHPDLVPSEDILRDMWSNQNINEEFVLLETEVEIKYDNWDKDQLINAILPENLKGGSAFSLVGHILHLNLREVMDPYKFVIAQILLDKLPNISVIVNKIDIIDNSDLDFGSFSMEKLAGDGDMVATVKENGCSFKLDFSKVYWNTRLSTEHNRICQLVNKGDILFDVMAGVGPFSVPIAKKGCQVFANDLNPFSVQYLKENSCINKVQNFIDINNIDGNKFIKTVFMKEYLRYLKLNSECTVHITMNLPSISLNFIQSFIHLFEDKENLMNAIDKRLPILHIYFFSNTDCKETALINVASKFFTSREMPEDLLKPYLIETSFVRKVSPTKVMMRVSCRIPEFVLWCNQDISEPEYKKVKLS